jgi:dolichol-phosphate mannosyltransferase
MDGDGQNNPADISLLLQTWALGQADVICGYRQHRRDTWSRVVASRLANGIRRLFLHDGVRDTGCSLKLFHRSAINLLPPFNGLHRYLPALFLKAGLTLEEVPVDHRSRTAGVSKYTNWKRALVGIHDLIGVSWLLRRHVIITTPHATTHARRPVRV